MEIVLDTMRTEDWEQVRGIYIEGLSTGNASFAMEAPSWEQWDGSHLAHSRIAAHREGSIVGWAALSPVSSRECYAGVAEVSVYVSESCRGFGLGKRLLRALIEASEENGIWSLYGSTFPENAASLRVQEECGFRVVGRREKIARHHGQWRDTVMTERRSKKVGVD
jgi:phosphinothricin acetyltransferase